MDRPTCPEGYTLSISHLFGNFEILSSLDYLIPSAYNIKPSLTGPKYVELVY